MTVGIGGLGIGLVTRVRTRVSLQALRYLAMLGLAAGALVNVASSAAAERAQKFGGDALMACRTSSGECSKECDPLMRSDGAAWKACSTKCGVAFQACRAEALSQPKEDSDADTPSEAGSTSRAPGALTTTEVNSIARRLASLNVQRTSIAVQPAALPECQRPVRDPMKCLTAQMAARDGAKHAEGADAPSLLAQVQQSLEADLAALPSDGLANFDATHLLNEKYRLVSSYARSLREAGAPRRNPDDPVLVSAARFEARRIDATLRATRNPQVKQAFVANRLNIPLDMALPPSEMFDWSMDRKTFAMQAELKASGKPKLFSERTTDLQQSSREASDARGYARWSEPSSEEVGLAMLRVLPATGGRMPSSFESARATNVIWPDSEAVNRLIHVEKSGPCVREGDAYRCPIRRWIQIFVRGSVMAPITQSAPLGRLYQAFIDAGESENGQQIEVLTRATPDGWQAPELIEAIRESDRRQAEMADATARRSACERAKQRSFGYLSPDCFKAGAL